MTTYATIAEYETYTGETAPEGLQAALNHSSVLVGRAIRNDLYKAQPNGIPEDDDLRLACMEACVVHAAALIRAGVDPLAGVEGIKPMASKKSIGSASIEYESVARQEGAKAALLSALAPTAFSILRNAGMAGAGVQTW